MRIYISEYGAKIRLSNNRLLVEKNSKCICSVPLELVDSLLVNSSVQITSKALIALSKRNASVSWKNNANKIVCSLLNESFVRVTRRKAQYALSDNKRLKAALSREIISAKIHNQLCLLAKMNYKMRYTAAERAVCTLSAAEKQCSGASISTLRGIEGMASRCYFSALSLFIDSKFGFDGRNRRPPKDRANAAFSYSYTLLYNYVDTILRSSGFDTFEGIIHAPRSGHRALASDIMEIFRSFVSDFATVAFLEKADTEADFDCTETSVYLSNAGRRKMIELFESRLSDEADTDNGYKNNVDGLILSQVDRLSVTIEEKRASALKPFRSIKEDKCTF